MSRSGWTLLKIVGVVVGLFLMVGFGLCSVFGFLLGGGDSGILVLSFLGAGIAALAIWMVVSIFKAARRDRDRDS